MGLDAFQVMPNHVHAVVHIKPPLKGEAGQSGHTEVAQESAHKGPEADDTEERTRKKRRVMLLPLIVGYYRTNVAIDVSRDRGTPGRKVWQRDYHEHVVRNARSLYCIRRYIEDNPRRWSQDVDNQDAPCFGTPEAQVLAEFIDEDAGQWDGECGGDAA